MPAPVHRRNLIHAYHIGHACLNPFAFSLRKGDPAIPIDGPTVEQICNIAPGERLVISLSKRGELIITKSSNGGPP